jgi:P27 family predicted phage terminase small subunit
MGQRGFVSAADVMKRNMAGAAANSNEPVPPNDLNVEGTHEWKRITGLLRDRNALDGLDQAALRDYLVCWQRLQDCEADIQKRGILVKGARGTVKNPSLQIAKSYRESMLAWARELGFTLGSRTRLALPGIEPKKLNKFAMIDAPHDQDTAEL